MRTDPVAVSAEISRWRALREQLLAMCPELADDDETLLDTLDGETKLSDIAAKLAIAVKEREAAEKATRELAARYQQRAQGHARAQGVMKSAIAKIAAEMGVKSIKGHGVSLSIRDLDDKVTIVDKEPEMAPDYMTTTKIVYDAEKVAAHLQEAVDMGIAVIEYDRKSVTIR